MKVGNLSAVVAAVLLFSVPGAVAQTTGTETASSGATDPGLTDTITLPAWPKAEVLLSGGSDPVPASFALGQVEGIDPNLLAGVSANGYARKVDVEDRSIGQVLITTVAKDAKEETISSEGLTAQFDASGTSELFPEKTVEVTGSKAELVAALERLAVDDDDGEEKEDTVQKTASEVTDASTVSDGSSNDIASGYTTPSTDVEPEEEEAPEVSYGLTTDGCEIRVDPDAGFAYVQNKMVTYTDGSVSEESECSDSGKSYPIRKSYLKCGGDEQDISPEVMKAWSLYSLYYVDDGGRTVPIGDGDCVKDENDFYAITEDESRCKVSPDFSTGQLVPQSALVYTNRNNAVIEARGCEDSTLSEPIEMTEHVSNCTLRHDFENGVSHEQTKWTYDQDGVTYIAADCSDDGVSFEHRTVYKDDTGEYLCKVLTDLDGGTATLQSHIAITVDGVDRYITDCTPDTDGRTVHATTDGCMDMSAWEHDVSASVSYGQERFYIEQEDGARHYVTACRNSGASYAQQHEIVGYQYHDDQLFAYPLTTVTVTANGNSYTIENGTVLDGAPQIAYGLEGETTQQTGDSTYEGCDGYYLTALYEIYSRPDDTTYRKQIGEGDPAGPRNVCNEPVLLDKKSFYVGLQENSHGACQRCSWEDGENRCDMSGKSISLSAVAKYSGHYQVTNFETGEVVSDYYDWAGGAGGTTAHGPDCTYWGLRRNVPWRGSTFSYGGWSHTCAGGEYGHCTVTKIANAPEF